MTSADVLIPIGIAPITISAPTSTYELLPSDEQLASARFYVPTYMGSLDTLQVMQHMPRLEVCQLLTAGFESALPHVPSGVTLCNAAGVHDASTAELALALILASLRGVDHAARDMPTGTWNHIRRTSLADSTVVIVGAGGVGRAIARRLEPFEVSVTLVGRSAREDVVATASLDPHLRTAHVVVIAVPLDATTHHLVDAEFLATMRDGALLVNVSRGGVVNQDDLLAETSTGRLRAALDVTDPEPLPSDHPLWTSPGVLITPHVGGDSTAFVPRGQRLIEQQCERWLAGESLVNIITAR